MAEISPLVAGSQLGSSAWLQGARRARRLATASLVWLCFEGAATTTAGLLAGSTALLANGLDGAIEGLASIIVVWRFSGSRTLSPSSERRAQRLVALSFFLLAPYIAFEGAHALLVEHRAESTLLGIGLSIATLCICPWLGRAKLRLGEQLASPQPPAKDVRTSSARISPSPSSRIARQHRARHLVA